MNERTRFQPRVFLSNPSAAAVAEYVEAQRQCEFTYAHIGCTRNAARSIEGFAFDQYRVRLGRGRASFGAAREALAAWRMFPRDWTRVIHAEREFRAGQTVAVLIRVFGLWWLNAARIVYVIDDFERQFGFAYGTLPGHVECGEERFLVERDEEDAVWYDLRAISQPRHWTTRWGYPLVRRQQRRFARDSQRAMSEAIAS
jgi:uncharacterized protein (UPF0548 family)